MNQITEVDESNTSRLGSIMNITSISIPQNDSHSIYKDQLKQWLNRGIAYLLFFLFLQFSIILEISKSISLMPLFGLDLILIFKIYFTCRSKPLVTFILSPILIHQLCSIAFKTMLIVCLELGSLQVVYLVIPIAITCIADVLKKVPKNHECVYLTWLVRIIQITAISKWLFALTMLNVGLKMSDRIDWQWSGVMWPVYIGLCFCAVVFVGIFLFTLGQLLSWLGSEIPTSEFFSTLWLLYSILGSGLTILCLCFQISNKSIMYLGRNYCIPPICFLLVFVVATCIQFDNLVNWWTVFFSHSSIDVESQPTPIAAPQVSVTLPRRISQAVKKVPKVLMRISSSYFQPVETPKRNSKRTFSLKSEIEAGPAEHKRTFSNPSKVEIVSPKFSNSVDKTCSMCFENPCNAVIMDCGHGGICYDCSLKLWKTVGMCHMCRSEISQVLQIEISQGSLVKVSSTTRAVYFE